MNILHRILGYGGLIPFIGLASIAHYPQELLNSLFNSQPDIQFWLISYAALIYSFIGGIYWSSSLINQNRNGILLLSIVMMLWAWMWVLMPDSIAAWLMALSFLALPLIEFKWLKSDWSDDFIKMRLQLSVLAGLSLLSLHL